MLSDANPEDKTRTAAACLSSDEVSSLTYFASLELAFNFVYVLYNAFSNLLLLSYTLRCLAVYFYDNQMSSSSSQLCDS